MISDRIERDPLAGAAAAGGVTDGSAAEDGASLHRPLLIASDAS
jgi:hypothetical protein